MERREAPRMRESKKTEQMQLPRDTTEVWLESQKTPRRRAVTHVNPPEDALEAWINKRVGRALKRGKTGA